MDLELKGKVAVITGGSQGIGLAIARGLAKEGVDLVLCARDEASLSDARDEIRKALGVRVLAVPADMTKAEDIARVVAQTEKEFGGADILINNAGTGTCETIMDAPDSKWQYYWDLHVMAAVRMSRGLIPAMRKRGGGAIVNNASICAKQPMGHEPIYDVTKAALAMLSKVLSGEVIKDNIRVNCVNPGLVLTEGWAKGARERAAATGGDWRTDLDEIARKHAPIGRFATAEEIADFFIFLCSPRASYCVGESYFVDGGWLNVVP